MRSDTLPLKTIINELVFLKKTSHYPTKKRLLLANKLIEKIHDPRDAK